MRRDLLELAAEDAAMCEAPGIAFEALRRLDEAEDAGQPTGRGEQFYPDECTGREALTVFRETIESRLGFKGLTARKAVWLMDDAERAEARERLSGSAFWHLSPEDGLRLGVCVVVHPHPHDPEEWCETAFEIEADSTCGDRWSGPEVFIRVTREARVDAAALGEGVAA